MKLVLASLLALGFSFSASAVLSQDTVVSCVGGGMGADVMMASKLVDGNGSLLAIVAPVGKFAEPEGVTMSKRDNGDTVYSSVSGKGSVITLLALLTMDLPANQVHGTIQTSPDAKAIRAICTKGPSFPAPKPTNF